MMSVHMVIQSVFGFHKFPAHRTSMPFRGEMEGFNMVSCSSSIQTVFSTLIAGISRTSFRDEIFQIQFQILQFHTWNKKGDSLVSGLHF